MAVRPDLRQVFSYLGEIAPGRAEVWVSTGAIWRDMLLAEALVGDKVYTGTHLEWVITNGSISDISLIKSISVFFWMETFRSVSMLLIFFFTY